MTDTPTPVADLVAALAELQDPPKTGKVEAGARRYAFMTLPDLLSAVRGTLGRHHIAVMQHVLKTEAGVSVTTTLLHNSGHTWVTDPLELPSGRDPQSVGSVITYGRRYQLAALVGLTGSDDDDARIASTPARGGDPELTTRPPSRAPAPPPRDFQRGSISPGTASDRSKKAMWALLRETRMDDDSIRGWVSEVLTIEPDWHTAALSQQQVSTIIERLKAEARPPDTTQPGAADDLVQS